MSVSPEQKAESKLDELFCEAFETNHPAMHCWALIKMELKKLRKDVKELSKIRVYQ